jgi:phage I-like protein
MTPPTITELSLACLAASAVVVGNGEVQKGQIELPAEIVICPWGESRDLDGNPVIVNETTLAELGMNQTKYGFDEIAMDFEHGTVPKRDADGKAIAPSEPVAIAGMGTLTVREGVGIVYQPVSWTTAGEPAYTGRHFRDLSPTVSKNEKGEVIFVHSVALCRNGQIRDLHAFSTPLSFSTALSTTPETKTKTMDAPNYRDLLRLKLSLPEDATDEQIVAGMESLSAPAKVEEKEPETTAMAAAGTPEVTALTARMDQMEKDNLVLQATAAGKIIPLSADALKLTPLSVVRELVEKATPGEVPTASSIAKKDPPRVQALSAEEKVVAARMGYSEEKWRELNPIA